MDLPVFRKGLELVSAQLNKLSQGIRAAQVTSVIGGSFTRTPAGTTIIINQQATGGGGAVALPCPFEATNASTETQQRVEIAQGMIATGNPYNPYQWPDGMGIGFPAYYLEITSSGYIYCKLVFDTATYFVLSDPTGITFLFSPTLLPNTETDQYFLIATIEFDAEIKNINNVCTSPVPDPCSLIYVPV